MSNDRYPKKYGAWRGNPNGDPPNFTRCCEEVRSGFHRRQCSHKRGYGPDGAYCKIHDPAEVKRRTAARNAKAKSKNHQRMLELYGPQFFAVLKKIAAGCDDPSACAASVIKKFEGAT